MKHSALASLTFLATVVGSTTFAQTTPHSNSAIDGYAQSDINSSTGTSGGDSGTSTDTSGTSTSGMSGGSSGTSGGTSGTSGTHTRAKRHGHNRPSVSPSPNSGSSTGGSTGSGSPMNQ